MQSARRLDRRDELLRRFAEAARRAQIVTIVNLARTEAELGELFTAELCEAFEAEIAFVLAEHDGGGRTLVGAYGLTPDQRAALLEDERCARAITDAQPLRHQGDLLAIGVRELVLAPFTGEVDRGVVGVARLYDERFDEGEVALLEAVAESLNHALERIRLGEERDVLLAREQAARREAEERGQAARVLGYVADGVFLVDSKGAVQLWNPAAEAITGLPADAALGRPVEEVIPGWQSLAEAVPIASAPGACTGPATTVPVEIGDRELWLSVAGVTSADGTVYAFRDRSEERRLEQLKEDFVATVSHELRTPIAAVYGAVQTLEREDVAFTEDLRRRLLSVISDQSERLAHVVNDILLTSEVESGRLVLANEQVNVVNVARRVIEAARTHAPDELSLELVAPPALAPIATDSDKLRQVLGNLVANAIKYSFTPGQIEVRLEPRRTRLRIAVRDEGVGIPRAEQERIFEKFYRLRNTTRAVGGTGLGLYICRELVRRMEGRIWVESVEDIGSTFFVELPGLDSNPPANKEFSPPRRSAG
ncbi:MAG TPA: ATP-binding protein [Gaiellaceae bacterium]|nr:ATP-binding protein [Gaiellaceae bacterium]